MDAADRAVIRKRRGIELHSERPAPGARLQVVASLEKRLDRVGAGRCRKVQSSPGEPVIPGHRRDAVKDLSSTGDAQRDW